MQTCCQAFTYHKRVYNTEFHFFLCCVYHIAVRLTAAPEELPSVSYCCSSLSVVIASFSTFIRIWNHQSFMVFSLAINWTLSFCHIEGHTKETSSKKAAAVFCNGESRGAQQERRNVFQWCEWELWFVDLRRWVVKTGQISELSISLAATDWVGTVNPECRVVSVLDSGADGPGFKSQSRHCRVTVLSKLFTPIVPLFTKQQNW